MMSVDISMSMDEPDMIISGRRMTRISAVKAVASDFIQNREGDRIGLILFGSQAYLQAPLTFDRKTVSTLLEESFLGLAGRATAIGDAIGLAVKRLRNEDEQNRVLILLTDGANTAGFHSASSSKAWDKIIDPNLLPILLQGKNSGSAKFAKSLLALGWLITVIALADPVWEKIPRPIFQTNAARILVLDLSNSMLVDDLKPNRLARAKFKVEDILSLDEEGQTGLVLFAGDAFTASPLTRDTETIRSLLKILTPQLMPAQGSRADLGLLKAHELFKQAGIKNGQPMKQADNANENTLQEQDINNEEWYSTGPLIALLLLPIAALAFRRGWILNIAFIAISGGVLLQPQPVMAFTLDDLWSTLSQNKEQRADAAFRNKDYEKASELSANARYNEGNSLAKLEKYEDAIKSYDKALEINPDMSDAKENKKAIEDFLKKQQEQQQSDENSKENSDSDSQEKQENKDSEGNKQDSEEQQNNEDGSSDDEQSKKDENQFSDANKALDEDDKGQEDSSNPALGDGKSDEEGETEEHSSKSNEPESKTKEELEAETKQDALKQAELEKAKELNRRRKNGCGAVSVMPLNAEVKASLNQSTVFEGDQITLNIQSDQNNNAQPDLKPLQKDFDIQGSSTSSQINIINGSRSFKKVWTIELVPKSVGQLEIPEITVGREKTNAVSVTVANLPPEVAAETSKHIFIESSVDLDNKETYVQQQIPYTVKLYYDSAMQTGEVFSPQIENANIRALGNDKKYQVVRRIALSGGDSPKLRKRMDETDMLNQFFGGQNRNPFVNTPFDEFFGRRSIGPSRPFSVSGESLDVNVLPVPESFKGHAWLPAEDLIMTDSWTEAPPELKVGEPVTRKLILQAKGLASSQIPDINIPKPAGMKVYVDQDKSETPNDGNTIYGIRQIDINYIPSKDGKVVIPEINVDWWDVHNKEQKTFTLPEWSLSVAPG
ncbi:hypothetical protein GQR58_023145 [Nymphon striatum]|nr:hypothetical protein GQR58_023145 [Nymphon striatum]